MNNPRSLFSALRFPLSVFLLLIPVISCGQAPKHQGKNAFNVDDSLLSIPVDTSYSFIRYDSNCLIIPADSSLFNGFAKKWHRLLSTGEGNISIVQIGASHVQGGTLPHRIRYNILTAARRATTSHPQSASASWLVSDRGLLFPYSAAAKCNNPYDYKIQRSHPLELTRNVYREPLVRLGLCGIAVTARDSLAEIGITLNEPDIDFATSSITLLGDGSKNVVPFLKVINNDTLILQPLEVDTTLRRYTYRLDTPADSFYIVLPCTPGDSFSITGVHLANQLPGISYHSIGVNGAAVSDYLNKCPHFTTDLALIKPDLVIFCIGINDASGSNFDTAVFRQRYLQLIDSVRSISPDCAFVFFTNNDSYRRVRRKYAVNENAILAREAFFRIAAATGGVVWDQFTVMGGLSSMEKWQAADLAQRDRIHFTRKGYQLIADLFSDALLRSLQRKP